MKSHFLSALNQENTLRPPVWLMRQAGRYIPEYRSLRQKHSFLDLCSNPDLITEVTLMPLKSFELDAAIVFSDILLPLKALNIPFDFIETKGPIVENNLDFDHLPTLDPARFKHQFSFLTQGIKNLKKELKVPLVGFAGAPFTLAAYIIEGGSSHSYEKTKVFAYSHPKKFHALLDCLTVLVRNSLMLQIDAGVDAIQVFDTHLNVLSVQDVRHFVLPSLQKVFAGLPVPALLFSKGNHWDILSEVKSTGLSVDWTVDLATMRKKYPSSVLQGNLDPIVLLSTKESIQKHVQHCLHSMGSDPAYIFNLGHGILPNTKPESVQHLIEAVHAFSPSIL